MSKIIDIKEYKGVPDLPPKEQVLEDMYEREFYYNHYADELEKQRIDMERRTANAIGIGIVIFFGIGIIYLIAEHFI